MKKLNIALVAMLLLFQTVFMPLGSYGVTFASESLTSSGTITDSIMTLVELSQNDSTNKLVPLEQEGYRVNAEQEVSVLYTMKLLAEKGYKAGDTYVLALPKAFEFTEQHEGDLQLKDKISGAITVFGEFKVNADLKTVTFTFNSEVENKTIEGQFGAWAAFTESVKQGELTQTIQFDDPKKSFTLDFAPIGGEISKTAKANKLMNANEVTWTVDVNKASRDIKGAKLSDTTTSTPANHTLAGNIEVYEITKVSMNGNVEVGATPTKTFTSFPINLGDIKKPYRVVYKSKLIDNKTTSFTNTATLTGTENGKAISQSDTFDIELPFYEHLVKQKDVKKEGQEITWTVLYNYDEKVIGSQGADGVITDTLTNNTSPTSGITISKHEYVDSSIKVEKVDGTTSTVLTRGTHYTATISNGQLIVDLADNQNGSTAGYKLTYDTKADNVVANFSVDNTVTADGISKTEGSTVKQTFFYKGYTVDYEKKEIKWTITANGFDMKNAVLTDTPDADLGAPKDLSIQLKGGPNAKTISDTSFVTTGGDLVLDFSKSDTKEWTAQDTLEVTYVTPIPEASTETNYNNVAGIKWLNSKDEWVVAEAFNATTTLKDDTKNNGYKRGQYNYTGDNYRTIDWEIGYNFNLDKNVTGSITDIWDANQQFVSGSKITIKPVKLLSDGTWSPAGDIVTVNAPTAGTTGFTFDIKAALGSAWEAGKPYILNYSTKFQNDLVPKEANNSVSFTGKNGHTYTLNANVPIKHGTEFATKEANTTSKPKHIQWSVYFNRSQTTIPDAVLTDTMEGPQQLVEDSITITQLNVTENGTEPTNITLTKGTDYNVNISDKTLTVTFNKTLEHAYLVQYDTYIANLTGEFKNSIGVQGNTTLVGGTTSAVKVANVASKSGAWGVGSISGITDPFNMELKVKKTTSGNNEYLKGTDYEAGKELAGAVFGLYLDGQEVKKADGTHVTATTGADGIATFTGLVLENYTVKELTPPKGFMNNSDAKTVTLNDPNNATGFDVVEFTNNKKIYDGSFSNACGMDGTYKVEGNGQTFNIKVTNGTPAFVGTPPMITLDENLKPQFATGGTAASITVDKYGDKLRIQNLPVGTYTITQTEVKPGYVAGGKATLTINDDKTSIQTSTAINCTPIKVTITNVEGDPSDSTPGTEDDPKIGGSTFKVYKTTETSCPAVGTQITTGLGTSYEDVTSLFVQAGSLVTVNGKVEIDFTKVTAPGKYVIVQDDVKSEYHIDRPNIVVSCVDITPTTKQPPNPPIFENERIPSTGATVEIVKTDKADANKAIEGAVFELKGTLNSKSPTYYGKTGADGKITQWYKSQAEIGTGTVQTIVKDNYILREVNYPTGYENFELNSSNSLFTTDGRTVKFNFPKDSNAVSIPVTNEKIDRPVKITNSCGLEQSTYRIVKDGTVVKTLSPGATIELTKKDGTKQTVLDNTTVFDSATGIITLLEGYTAIEIKNVELAAGTYDVEQLTTSGGCKLTDDPTTVTVTPDKDPDTTITVEEDDEPVKTPVTNEDPDGNKLEGSEFEVYKFTSCPQITDGKLVSTTGGELVGTFKTDSNGVTPAIDFSQYGSGTYVVVQKGLSEENKQYFVDTPNKVVQIDSEDCLQLTPTTPNDPNPPTFENERGEGELVITKVDASDKATPVAGAEITITANRFTSNPTSYKGVTDTNGKVIFGTKIPFNDYTITETKFPAGYEGFATALTDNKFIFKTDTVTIPVEITNKKIERTVTITDACTLGERVYGIYAPDGSTKLGEVTLAAGESSKDITMNFTLPDGQSTANFVVKQLSSTNPECEQKGEPTFPIERDEDPTPEKPVTFTGNVVTLTFESCEGPLQSGTFTLVNKNDITKSYTATVGTDGQVKLNIPAGTYTITELNDKEVTIPTSADSKATVTIETEDCGEVNVTFQSCEKDATGISTVDIYEKSSTTKVATVDASSNWTATLPVGDYTAYLGGSDPATATGTDFTITKGGQTVTIVNEPCKDEVVTITFAACDKLGTTTVDIYEKNSATKVATVDASSNWKASLQEGDYVAYPGGTTSGGTAFTVGKQAISSPITVTEPCGDEEVVLTFDACEKATNPITTIDVYEADANDQPIGTATTISKDGNGQYIAKLDVGSYIAYPGGTTTNGTPFEVTTAKSSVIKVVEPCPAELVTIEFDRCEKAGKTTVDIYSKDDMTKPVATVDASTNWTTALDVGDYYAYPGGTTENGTAFSVTKKDVTATVKVTEPCDAVPVTATVKTCDKLGNTMVDVYEVDSNNELIVSTKKSVPVVDGEVKTSFTEGSYVIVPLGTTSFDPASIITIDETTVGTITVNVTENCNGITVTFKTCDGPAANVEYKFVNNNDSTKIFTVKTDSNGQVTTTIPPGVYTVTNTATGDEKVVDVTTTITNLTIVDCEACTAEVKVPELAGQTITVTDGKLIETVTVDPTGTFSVPFENGSLTVKDSTGKVVGTITVADCKGEFTYPACENPTISLPDEKGKDVYILPETAVGGKITSPDAVTVDVATITITSEDTVTVLPDGELTINKDNLDETLEYYIVNDQGEILKVIHLDGEDLVVSKPTREEETRIEDCLPKKPIPFEPTPEPVTPPVNPPVTPPTGGDGESTPPTTPPTTGGGGGGGTPPVTPVPPTGGGTPPVTPTPPSTGGGGGGGSSTPPAPEVTPEEPPTTPPTITPEQPVTPPVTPEQPPVTPELAPVPEVIEQQKPPAEAPVLTPQAEQVVEMIPTIPGIVPTTNENGETTYRVPSYEDVVKGANGDREKLQQTLNEIDAFLNMYDQLTPEEQAEIDKLIDVKGLKTIRERLQDELVVKAQDGERVPGITDTKAASGEKKKLPQTDGAAQTTTMFAGMLLVLASMYAFFMRRRKQM